MVLNMIKKIFRYLFNSLASVKLRTKLFISYLLFIIAPLILFTLVTYSSFSEVIRNYVFFSVEKSFNMTFSYVSVKLNKVITTSEVTLRNENVKNIFSRSDKDYNIIENNKYINDVTGFLSSLQDSNDINRVILYVPSGNSYSASSYYFRNLNDTRNKKWYDLMKTSPNNSIWCPYSYFDESDFEVVTSERERVLSLIQKVKNENNFAVEIGLIRVDFKENSIKEIIKMSESVKGSVTYIQNSENINITASDDQLFNKLVIPVSQLHIDAGNEPVLQPATINGEKVFYLVKKFKRTDWNLVTVIPYGEIVTKSQVLQKQILLIILLISTIAFLFAWLVAYSITRRISKLKNKMKAVQNGELNSIIETNARDEIGDLTRSYNYMIEKITELIDESYMAGIEVKNAELKVLQAQINPHFLYNTLDMINWLAKKNRPQEVEQVVNSLAMYYKLSLSKGREEVTIADELEHISYYVQIQDMRFPGKINLIIDIDEEITRFLILKLTLQPIIENAIHHGILKKSEKEGTIIIEGMVREGVIVLRVQDDGIGMSEDEILRLETSNYDYVRFGGYGVKNVIERIKLFYGEEYGLSYKSLNGNGTSVEIRIPAKE